MNRSIAPAELFGFSVWAASGLAFAQSPVACSLISEKEALTLVGGPLGEIAKSEMKPTAQNDHTHYTECGFFPKGFDQRKATRPPERGLELSLTTTRNNAAAQAFYESLISSAKEMAKEAPGAEAPGFAGWKVKVSPLSDMGVTATLEVKTSEPEPKVVYHVASVHFLKGGVMGTLIVWQTAGPADQIARAAAKRIIANLP